MSHDNLLNFNLHIALICGKLSKIVEIFFRMHNLVPDFVLIKLYYSMVHPYQIYFYLAWSGAPGIYVNRLFAQQIKII